MGIDATCRWAATVVAAATLAMACAAVESRVLSLDDLLSLRGISDPQISPDGRWVAYTVGRNDLERDEARSQIFMTSLEDSETVRLTADDYAASTPRWSPDGRYLGFLAAKTTLDDDREATTQVWTLDRRGGDAEPYTAVAQGVVDFAWSPDGRRMALLIRDQSASELAAAAAEAEGVVPKPLPYVIDRLQFKEDEVYYLDRSRTHVYLLDARGGVPVQLTAGDYDDEEPVWSPDGGAIAFVSNRTAEPDTNDNTDIWLIDVPAPATAGKGRKPTPRQITRNPGADHSPSFSHDGRRIAYVTVTEPEIIWYATSHLAVVSTAGGDEQVLTAALDRNVRTPRFTPDDRTIVFTVEDSAELKLAELDLTKTGADALRFVSGPVDNTPAGIAVWAYAMGRSGEIVALVSLPHLPGELFRFGTGVPEQLTRVNAGVLEGVTLAGVHNVTFTSADGTAIEGFLVTPPDYRQGRRYPTILWIHGGPVSSFDFSFNPEAQWFAANGYVVVLVNPRGSSGYGQAFAHAIWADWGNRDFEDVMAGVDHAINAGYADPQRLGVGGWSYGGILTNYVITRSDRFKAAISGASEVNYPANYGHDHYQLEWEAELGLPWENREAWERISPWNRVDRIVTPTLVMGGDEDWNVPIQNSEQLYIALKRRGVPTQLVVYPDETHTLSRPSFVGDSYERFTGWYDRYLKGHEKPGRVAR